MGVLGKVGQHDGVRTRGGGRRNEVVPITRLHTAYHWIRIPRGRPRFLNPLFESLGLDALRVWTERGTTADSFDRRHCNGLVTAAAEIHGRTVAVGWSDFRVNAASYGRSNSRRFAAFLQALDRSDTEPVPLIYVVNSAGISLMEGRSVFAEAFALWPALLDYAAHQPVLTCAVGKCLGLAPLLYGLGHYRIAVGGQTQLNLTGPEVLSLFFGKGCDFARDAAAERFVERNDLVHELVPSLEAGIARFLRILFPAERDEASALHLGPRTDTLLRSFLDRPPLEVVPGWCDRVRLFLGTRNGQPLGLFLNPLEQSNNLISVRTLEKYAAGLDLFRALGAPIVSFLDSPGIDPRVDQSDANNLRKMLWVGEKIIRYPHGAMAVVTARCFGGATTLAFPKVFGGLSAVALRGSRIGAMDERIIDRLLNGSPRLLAEWRHVATQQGPECEDLLLEGIMDALVEPAELPHEIDRFLARAARPVRALKLRRRAP